VCLIPTNRVMIITYISPRLLSINVKVLKHFIRRLLVTSTPMFQSTIPIISKVEPSVQWSIICLLTQQQCATPYQQASSVFTLSRPRPQPCARQNIKTLARQGQRIWPFHNKEQKKIIKVISVIQLAVLSNVIPNTHASKSRRWEIVLLSLTAQATLS
jgi:hypothetical protein